MTVEIPNLDKKTWRELRDWMVMRIPSVNAEWTDYNYSDPGITVLELLAWVAETLLYRENYIPEINYLNVARLVAGATEDRVQEVIDSLQQEGKQNKNTDFWYIDFLEYVKTLDEGYVPPLADLQERVLNFFYAPYTCVTNADIKAVTLQSNRMLGNVTQPDGSPLHIVRAYVKNGKEYILDTFLTNLKNPLYTPQSAKNWASQQQLPQGSSVVLITQPYEKTVAQIVAPVVKAVDQFLAPRKLGGIPLSIKAAVYTAVNIELSITCPQAAALQPITSQLTQNIIDFLNPLTGGPNGTGWELNQAPTTYQILNVSLKTYGVQSVDDLVMDFAPSWQLGVFSSLGIDTLLQPVPLGLTVPTYRGLPYIRVLTIAASNATGGS